MPSILCTAGPRTLPLASSRPLWVSTMAPPAASRRITSGESWLPETAMVG